MKTISLLILVSLCACAMSRPPKKPPFKPPIVTNKPPIIVITNKPPVVVTNKPPVITNPPPVIVVTNKPATNPPPVVIVTNPPTAHRQAHPYTGFQTVSVHNGITNASKFKPISKETAFLLRNTIVTNGQVTFLGTVERIWPKREWQNSKLVDMMTRAWWANYYSSEPPLNYKNPLLP